MREHLHAPLPERVNKHHGYHYRNPYSLFEGLDDSYLSCLNEALALLQQLSKSNEFIGLEDLLLRLEQRVVVTPAEQNRVTQSNAAERVGRHHLIGLYWAIQKQVFLRIKYRPYQGEASMVRWC